MSTVNPVIGAATSIACSSVIGTLLKIGHFDSTNPLQAFGSSIVNGIARDPNIKLTLAVNVSESRALRKWE